MYASALERLRTVLLWKQYTDGVLKLQLQVLSGQWQCGFCNLKE